MTSFLFALLYDYIIAPLLVFGFRALSLSGNEKVRLGLAMRKPENGVHPWERGKRETRPIWIHCASGEFEYAKPVISAIKRLSPNQKILVSYFSPSAQKAIQNYPGVDFHTPAPLENKKDLQSLIDYHKPAALLIARTDTWPLMLRTARKNGIPSLLFSATLSEAAGRLRGSMRAFTTWTFSFLDQIFCVTEADQALFTTLGSGRITQVEGDTRFDQVLARLANPKPLKPLFANTALRQIFVVGSSWNEDEAELLPVIAALNDRLKFIIAPHEPHEGHLQELEEKLAKINISSVRYSTLSAPTSAAVILVDQVGVLAELYQSGAFAFVGGSFRKTVHSVMEPLGAGCFTFLGPLHHNNREALEFKTLSLPDENRKLKCVIEVADAEDWKAQLSSLIESYQDNDRVFIRDQVVKRSGRSETVAKWAVNAVVRSSLRR